MLPTTAGGGIDSRGLAGAAQRTYLSPTAGGRSRGAVPEPESTTAPDADVDIHAGALATPPSYLAAVTGSERGGQRRQQKHTC